MSIQRYVPFMVIVGCLILAGCNDSPDVAHNSQQSAAAETETQITPPVIKTQTTSVTATKLNTETSPAAAANEPPPIDATPAEICKRFMELLKSGNRNSAANLLTRSALTTTSDAGLQLEPMGGPTAKYEVTGTSYATIKNNLAHVDCKIVEVVNGQEETFSVTWMVRKQNLGWRVAGLLVDLGGSGSQDLLSFENKVDVNRIMQLAAGEVIEDTSRVSAVDQSELK